jgi:hypothetical protein
VDIALTLLFWLTVWLGAGGAVLIAGWRGAASLKEQQHRRIVRSLLIALIFGFTGFGTDGAIIPVPAWSLLFSSKYWIEGALAMCFWWAVSFFAMEFSGKGGE